jgi:hypothetical protein
MNKLANRKNEKEKKGDLIKATGKKGGNVGFTV